ncbi:MAG: SDR family NAD(P)-dependent oxidoreductase [Alphaproteobacteria bacterium]|nr:MAG: SDR family NAD(P)-dependent oxidoreductase [Alphaproteobacteria bacterium]
MKVAVITGGAGGLGQALSRKLLTRDFQVVLIDRDFGALTPSPHEEFIQCDLTNRDELHAAVEQILTRHPVLHLVIYNAGVTQIGAFQDQSEESHRKVFEINYFAAVAMAKAFLPAIRAGKGVHLAISSVAGFAPLYLRTSYAASKHAMEGFFKSLRSEEKAYDVRVQIAAPSFVATNLGNAARQEDGIARPGSATDGKDYMTPDAAADEILKGLDRGSPMILIGRVARLSWWINRLSPRLYQKLMEREISGG